MMSEFRYSLIRFVADRDRMEPVNAGVILQGAGRLDFKLQPGFARRGAVDTDAWRRWKQFFDEEIRGASYPLFQPGRDQVSFLQHLRRLCNENVLVSEPLLHVPPEGQTFDTTLQALYERLAAPTEESPQSVARRPTARFKQVAEQRRFARRGMKKSSYVHVGQEPLWQAYCQIENGMHIAIDKVEVGRELHLTAMEIQILLPIINYLPRFLASHEIDREHKYILFVDSLEQPFTGQTDDDFNDMKGRLDQYQEMIAENGGTVVQQPMEVDAVAAELELSLDPIETSEAEDE